MASLRDIKTRLRGVRKTQQITRAMKMVATVKLRHAQAALDSGRPHAERMNDLAADLLAGMYPPPADNPFFARRQFRRGLLMIIASDRGLCGSMNANIFRYALRLVDDLRAKVGQGTKPEIELLLIGRKANDYFKARQNIFRGELPYKVRDYVSFAAADAGRLGRQMCEFYREREFDRIDVLYNKSSSAMHHQPDGVTLLPVSIGARDRKPAKAGDNFIFEPPREEMLGDVVGAYVASAVQKILLEAAVAEETARMVMMDLATKNADDLISDMQLAMNKLRQLAITTELADITTGAEALA